MLEVYCILSMGSDANAWVIKCLICTGFICLTIMYSDIPLSQGFLAWCLRQTRAWVRTKK